MKLHSTLLTLAAGALFSLSAIAADEAGFKPLFDGKTLTGWDGRKEHWTVADGCIVGTTTKEIPAKGNNFLIAKVGEKNRIVGDFELRLSYKFSGDFGNSGIQFRSEELPDFVVKGYQADCEVGKTYSGILYEERGRGILAKRGEKVVIHEGDAPNKPKIEVVGSLGKTAEIQEKINVNGWNDYTVIVKGNHIQQFINGMPTVDVTDETAIGAKEGILALQLHAGPPMKIEFKNIRIKELK